MLSIPLETYPNSWTECGGGILREGAYIAENAETGCRLSVSAGSLGGVSYSLTAGEALSFADGATVLEAGIKSKEETAALAVRFMRGYPLARWKGGWRGQLVDGDGNRIRFPKPGF